ncbi:MAG: DUF6999 family protein [Alphaproteobacteria bacterium]
MLYDLNNHDFNNPDPWIALALDRSTFFDSCAKEALMRNNASRSRQIILPLIRPIARLSIALIKLVRIIIPSQLTSARLLHQLIVWGMKNFVSADANYLILRHFHIGSQTLRFLGDNIANIKMKYHPLAPQTIDDMGNNSFVQHDLNIYNFIIQLNAQLNQQGREIEPVALNNIDFTAITDFDQLISTMPNRWHNFLDLQSAIEIYTPIFAIFLSDTEFWRASNSLQLDETIAIYVARLFNRESILGLVNNKHPCVPLSTFEAGFRLMLHGLDAENLYGFLKYMQKQQEASS